MQKFSGSHRSWRPRPVTPLISAVVLCLLPSLATACTPAPSSPGDARSSVGASATPSDADQPKVRTDRQPIARRFTALGDFESVRWLGGAHGTPQSHDRLPGPTDYWIEAAVRLRASDLARLRDRHGWRPVAAPTARPALRSALPTAGRWVTEPGLTEEILTTSGMSGEVRLHPATRTVYVSAGTR